ncbi:MAG: C2 family cysteine protease [Pseudomonadota bacterium]
MEKAEAQHTQTQSQPAARQRKGPKVVEPSQSKRLGQLEAIIESSPQAAKQAQLTARISASPAMAAQRKFMDMVDDDPRQIAQRKTEPAGKPNDTGLPDNLKSGIESLSGMSMDNVKVHYNSLQPAQLNALAYTQASDIHVATGQERHLPHEAWHVVQQAQGRVKPTVRMKDAVLINDDKTLEHEADVMGSKASGGVAQCQRVPLVQATNGQAPVMQLFKDLTKAELSKKAGEKFSELQYVEDLLKALDTYETTSNEDPVALATALDQVVVKYKVAKDKLDTEVWDNKRTDLEPLNEWIVNQYGEVRTERDQVVLLLPIASRREEMLKKFEGDASLTIGDGIRALVESGEPDIGKSSEEMRYETSIGLPFGEKGPVMEDVKQGELGDCWLLAPLISLVNSKAGQEHIRNMIQPHGSPPEAYTVRLFDVGEKFAPRSVTVSSRFPAYKSKKSGNIRFIYAHGGHRVDDPPPLWPAIIEKALAKLLKGFTQLSGSTRGAKMAFESILGREAPQQPLLGEPLIKEQDQQLVAKLVTEGKLVVVSTETHYWSVMEGGVEGLVLRNPHGKTEKMTWSDLKKMTYHVGPDL